MRARAVAIGLLVVTSFAGVVLDATPGWADGVVPEPGTAYVLEGELTPDQAIPGPGPDSAGAFPTFIVSPEQGTLCYDIGWNQMDAPTDFAVRLGLEPEPLDEVDVTEVDVIEVDFAVSAPTEFEAGPASGFVAGCLDVETDPLDFLVHEAELSHVTLYTQEHPQGAVGGFLRVVSWPESDPDEFEDEGPFEAVTSVLFASLDVEQVVPTRPDAVGSGEAMLEVTPDLEQMCWDITWDLDSPATVIHLHVSGAGDVDGETFRFDFLREARHFGGTVRSDAVEGCIVVFHVVDFRALVADPEGHYIDIHTEADPDGALRGQLSLETDFVTTIEPHDHEEDSGRGPVDLVPHGAALLAVLGVTVSGVATLRRSRGLYDPPPASAVAATVSAFAALVVAAALMILDVWFAPAGDGTALCSDYDRYGALGMSLTVLAIIGAGVAVVMTRRRPSLDRVAIGLLLGAVVVAIAWFLWIPPQGCAEHDDVEHFDSAAILDLADDLLDCTDRVSVHSDPDHTFEGYATPEEAVAATRAGELGAAKHYEGRDWLIEVDGQIVAIVTADDWNDDRFVAFDMELCSDMAKRLSF